MYAINADSQRVLPERHGQAFCPGCRASVHAKCGDINVWHWAHVSGKECDPWYEPETPWHVNWKLQFQEPCREVVIGEHRADVRATWKGSSDRCVIELQHSAIEPADILEREAFYGKFCDSMLWVIDASDIRDHFIFSGESRLNGGATIKARVRWKWFRQRWTVSRRNKFLDFGDGLWFIEGIDEQGRGEVRSCTYHEFLSSFEESAGHNLPVHWKPTSSGGLVYRFGCGNVLMYQKNGLYQFGVFWDGSKQKFSNRKYRTAEDARKHCEPHMATLMKRSLWERSED